MRGDAGEIKRRGAVAIGVSLFLLAAACGKATESKEMKNPPRPSASVPDIQVSGAARAKALDPRPAPDAETKPPTDGFGKGRAYIVTKEHPGGASPHSFWAEHLDVDGSGHPVLVDLAWDNPHKVLYISRERGFGCRNGGTADGAILTAIYGQDNKLGKTAGSGWWVADLEEGECGVPAAGLYGCRFDSDGSNTECGSMNIVDVNDDVIVSPLLKEEDSLTGRL